MSDRSQKQPKQESEAMEADEQPEVLVGSRDDATAAVRTQGADASAEGEETGPPRRPQLEKAQRLMAGGQLTEAIDAYSAAVQAEPENVEALLGLGAALLQQAHYEAAEREFRRALKFAPDRVDAHYQLGLTLYKKGVYESAAAQLRRAVDIDPEHAPAYVVLGESLNQMGEPESAVDALERALELQPSNGRAFYALGIAFDRKGQPERAAEMYRRSREVGGR